MQLADRKIAVIGMGKRALPLPRFWVEPEPPSWRSMRNQNQWGGEFEQIAHRPLACRRTL